MSYIFKAPTKVCLASNPEFYQIRYTTLYKGARASTDRQTDTGIHTVKHRHKQIWSWYDANIFIFLCVKDWTVNIKIRPKKINIGQKCKNLQFSSKLKKKHIWIQYAVIRKKKAFKLSLHLKQFLNSFNLFLSSVTTRFEKERREYRHY